jgi:DNA (cytosine-5)-methyltransferase 1
MSTPSVISLFTGAGGLDHGFEAAGFRTAVAVEMDKDCVTTLRKNTDWAVFDRPIEDVSTKEILERGDLRRKNVDVVLGGPPCQPFSKAGYWANGDAARLNDPRAKTLAEYFRVVEEVLPRCFVLENVPGLAFSRKSEGLEFIQDQVRKINRRQKTKYRICAEQLNAAEHGVPQLRQRIFVVGARDGAELSFPTPTHAALDEAPSDLLPYKTAWDALADVRIAEAERESLRLTGKWAELLPSIPEGQNYLHHTERGDGLAIFGWRRRYWSFLLKLAKELPSWTVQAQPGPAIGPFHWNNRHLSMRELCRIQTFPDRIKVSGSRRAVQRQVGNAVPSLLAEVVAREVRSQLLDGHSVSERPSLLPPRRRKTPAPEALQAVPEQYLDLVGDHAAHPGTGLGYSAASRG